MEKTIGESFEEFLIENNCFSQFCINLLEQEHLTFKEYIEKHLKQCEEYNTRFDITDSWNLILLDAFNFTTTSEGSTYWMKIYYK